MQQNLVLRFLTAGLISVLMPAFSDAADARVRLVEKGQARAVVVTADVPTKNMF
ncbi:MAG: hypothetical protein JXM70_10670 [Pirellulales bacterium]|nr:hypothetical protein [Pirellulales bacterium]